jgi:hypothetical protein
MRNQNIVEIDAEGPKKEKAGDEDEGNQILALCDWR